MMRVVYDLLNSQGSRDQDDEATSVFSLPATTALPAAAAAAAAAAVSSSSSSVTADARTTMRSSPLRMRSAKKKDNDNGSSSSLKGTRTKPGTTTKSIKRRADAIINWLSVNGCASEVNIRSVIGNTPDTSKALRLLVKKAKVKRTGTGGRTDPFLYMVAPNGMTQS